MHLVGYFEGKAAAARDWTILWLVDPAAAFVILIVSPPDTAPDPTFFNGLLRSW